MPGLVDRSWSRTVPSLGRANRPALLTAADGGHGEESPPEAVEEGPVVFAVVLLCEVDETGEGEDRDADQHDEQTLSECRE